MNCFRSIASMRRIFSMTSVVIIAAASPTMVVLPTCAQVCKTSSGRMARPVYNIRHTFGGFDCLLVHMQASPVHQMPVARHRSSLPALVASCGNSDERK